MTIEQQFNALTKQELVFFIDNYKQYADFNTLGLYRSVLENESLTIKDKIEIRDYANKTFRKTFDFLQIKDPYTYVKLISLGEELTKADEKQIWRDVCQWQGETLKDKKIKHRNFGDYSKHNCGDINCVYNGLMVHQSNSRLKKIEEGTGCKIEFVETGTEPDYPFPRYDVPAKSSYYILRHGWSSALICGDTEKCVPFYKIPYTDKLSTDYSNIWSWERHHSSLFRLWLNSQPIAEEFALEQLQNVHSEDSKLGREICAKIEELTGVPTYYFLFNSRRWTGREDLDRKCPLTNQEWRIEGKTASDFIAFKCDESRLVSELSHNCKTG